MRWLWRCRLSRVRHLTVGCRQNDGHNLMRSEFLAERPTRSMNSALEKPVLNGSHGGPGAGRRDQLLDAFFACFSLRLSLMLFFGDFTSFFGDLSPTAQPSFGMIGDAPTVLFDAPERRLIV